jgi:histidyl-tRNA synthetase
MIQRPKGTKDIYGHDQKIYSLIFSCFESLAKSYNFQKITTPIFESLSLFKDTSGEMSDIVVKELYSFKDLSNRELALRPEGTAPVARALVENKLLVNKKFNKLFYIGPMFRYEKPQKGRMRQFYQIGTELVGDNSIYSVLEIINLAHQFLQDLKINDTVLKINNIGTKAERETFSKELSTYFTKNQKELSDLSISRINVNPLRILDDKIDSQKPVVLNAPKINDFIAQESQKSFDELLSLLKTFGIAYEVDPVLVRGLDYYTNVVFEFESNSKTLGTKSTIIGGGCYDNLIQNSGQDIVGVGFGVGVERLFEIIKDSAEITEDQVDVYFMLNNPEELQRLFPIICQLRQQNIIVDFNKKFAKQKKVFADAMLFGAKQIVYYELFGNPDNELITIKNTIKNIKNEVEKNKVIDIILEGIKNEKTK